MTLFDYLYEDFRFEKDKPIRVVELFSGIGFQSMGMVLAEVPYEVVAISEIDKFAILSYASIHTDYLKTRGDYDFRLSKDEMVETLQSKNVGYNFSSGRHTITKNTNIETVKDYFLADKLSNNLGDISLLKASDFPKDIDIMTYSFPCQDLSKAGQRKGLSEDTRSGLIYEVLRILHELKEINNLPKVPIMENVVDLIQVKFIDAWNKIAYEIGRLGYTNYTQTLNAKNYGIAQNRDRVFMVSILGEYNYNFPRGFELEHRLKDYLEEEVDEKYYLSDRALNGIKNTTFNSSTLDARTEKDGVIPTLLARDYKDPKLVVENEEPKIIAQRGRYTENGIEQQFEVGSSDTSNTLTTVQKDNYLLIPEATKKGYAEAYEGDGVYINRPHQKRGVVQDGMTQTLKTSGNDVGVVVGSYDYGSSDNFMGGKSRLVKDPDVSNTIITSPNVGVAIADNRFYRQALETLEENDVEYGDSINAYNKSVDRSGISPTLTTRPEGFKTAVLPVVEQDKIKRFINDNYKDTGSVTDLPKVFQAVGDRGNHSYSVKDIPNTIPANAMSDRGQQIIESSLRIRKLTPVETGRLMGMNDEQINKQLELTSNAQAYKQHGNGIVAQVIGLIIGMMVYEDENELRETVMGNSHTWLK